MRRITVLLIYMFFCSPCASSDQNNDIVIQDYFLDQLIYYGTVVNVNYDYQLVGDLKLWVLMGTIVTVDNGNRFRLSDVNANIGQRLYSNRLGFFLSDKEESDRYIFK